MHKVAAAAAGGGAPTSQTRDCDDDDVESTRACSRRKSLCLASLSVLVCCVCEPHKIVGVLRARAHHLLDYKNLASRRQRAVVDDASDCDVGHSNALGRAPFGIDQNSILFRAPAHTHTNTIRT